VLPPHREVLIHRRLSSVAAFWFAEAHAGHMKQWADSITAVLDDLDSREAVLLATDGHVSH
jgi:hypothetical protein